MRSLSLFRSTFQRLQTALTHGEYIKQKVLPQARKRPILERLERTMFILNCLEHNAMDLQSVEVETELAQFQTFLARKGMTSSYDYEGRGLRLVSQGELSGKVKKLEIRLRSVGVQKYDHPVLRQSLYFHELKNIDQHMNITYPKNAPRFIKDIYKRNVQNQILDKRNPLGLPLDAPSLQLLVQLNDLFTAELHCRYGYINIRSVRLLRHSFDESGQSALECHHVLKGLNIPRPVQNVFYELCNNELGLKEPELFLLHKMAYVGGRVEEVEFLLNLFDYYTAPIPLE